MAHFLYELAVPAGAEASPQAPQRTEEQQGSQPQQGAELPELQQPDVVLPELQAQQQGAARSVPQAGPRLGEGPKPRVARPAKLVSVQPEQERSVLAPMARQVEQPMARQQRAERAWLPLPVLLVLAQKAAQPPDAAAQLRDAALPQEPQPSAAL